MGIPDPRFHTSREIDRRSIRPFGIREDVKITDRKFMDEIEVLFEQRFRFSPGNPTITSTPIPALPPVIWNGSSRSVRGNPTTYIVAASYGGSHLFRSAVVWKSDTDLGRTEPEMSQFLVQKIRFNGTDTDRSIPSTCSNCFSNESNDVPSFFPKSPTFTPVRMTSLYPMDAN